MTKLAIIYYSATGHGTAMAQKLYPGSTAVQNLMASRRGPRQSCCYFAVGFDGLAMGHVYEALHLNLKQPVAVKVLNAKCAEDQTAVRRFIREARAATAIGSDHIVQVTDGGALPDGSPYLVMEFLDGHDPAPDSQPRAVVRLEA